MNCIFKMQLRPYCASRSAKSVSRGADVRSVRTNIAVFAGSPWRRDRSLEVSAESSSVCSYRAVRAARALKLGFASSRAFWRAGRVIRTEGRLRSLGSGEQPAARCASDLLLGHFPRRHEAHYDHTVPQRQEVRADDNG